jgi:hypothetical protein
VSTVASARGFSRRGLTSVSRSFFESPQRAGRKITAGFSYLQRIAKAGSYEVWFPDDLKQELASRHERGLSIGSEQFGCQWAAVRQFELLHESGNHKIYDLEVERLPRALLDLSRGMRAGGYRMTIATVGRYEETSQGDELEILDKRLQEGIATMIHMLYLDEASDQVNIENDARLSDNKWDYRQDLPHIGIVLGAADLFIHPQKHSRRQKIARQFFDILNSLPQNHLVHDTAIGLQLPELNGENQWNYIASPEETLGAFNLVLSNVFDKFNGISLSRLNEHADAHNEIKASTLHLRSYGDRTDPFLRAASLSLN